MDLDSVWEQALGALEGKVAKQVFDTWFKPLMLYGVDHGVASIGVPNKFFGEWLDEHYRGLLAESMAAVLGRDRIEIAFVATGASGKSSSAASQERSQGQGRPRRVQLPNPRYTFRNFVVGASNQFAHAASLAVAEAPARVYNPLFIYGGVGLGKTHLLNAIGNLVSERSDLRIAYVTTEQFTNEVINSIRYDKMIELRKRYRTIDMLLIDDIQFLTGKERTQEEFFHTFNTLYESSKQVVLSSDRSPKAMPSIEERLRSRFEWGLIADLQPPDVETRIAILRKKSEDEGMVLPEEVVQFLAANLHSNIRELEGSLVRLSAYASLTGQLITLEMAKTILRDLIGDKKQFITVEDIQEKVATKFHVKVSELKSKRRTKTLVYPRQIAMYLSRELTETSYPEIGRLFGGKDHTTIIHACKHIEKAKEDDHALRAMLDDLREEIGKR